LCCCKLCRVFRQGFRASLITYCFGGAFFVGGGGGGGTTAGCALEGSG